MRPLLESAGDLLIVAGLRPYLDKSDWLTVNAACWPLMFFWCSLSSQLGCLAWTRARSRFVYRR